MTESVYIIETIEPGPGNLAPSATLAEHIKANSKGRDSEYRRITAIPCPACAETGGRKADTVVSYFADRDGREYRVIPARRMRAVPDSAKIPVLAHDLPKVPSPSFTSCSRCQQTYLVATVAESVKSARWQDAHLQPVVQSTYARHPEHDGPTVTHEVELTPLLRAMIEANTPH